MKRKPISGAALAAVSSVALVGSMTAPSFAAPTTPADETAEEVPESTVLTPEAIPLTADDVINPLRGQYLWMGYPNKPEGWEGRDLYYRDQVYWGRLEPVNNDFNWAPLDAGFNQAKADKSKFGFRVMSYCPGCWMHSREDWEGWGPVTPEWMKLQEDITDEKIPDWNSEEFLSEWDELWGEMKERYGDRAGEELGYIDVGGYGAYGEMHVGRGEKITKENWLRMVGAVAEAFPDTWVLINTMTPADWTLEAVETWDNVGLRTDNLGAPNMYSMVPVSPELQHIWKTRPFFTEWATIGDPVKAAEQVPTWHISTTSSGNLRLEYDDMTDEQKEAYETAIKSSGYRFEVDSLTVKANPNSPMVLVVDNVGSAPTYEAWDVTLTATPVEGDDEDAVNIPVDLDLRDALPGPSTVSIPHELTDGEWNLAITVTDPANYSAPMNLAIEGRQEDGSYNLGTVTIDSEAVEVLPATAVNDLVSTPFETAVTVDVLANDTPSTVDGEVGTFAPDTLTFLLEGEEVSTIEGPEGVYTVVEGEVNFAPAEGYSGMAEAVTYQVTDTHGEVASATVQVTVDEEVKDDLAPMELTPDEFEVAFNGEKVVDVLANDTPTEDSTFVEDSLTLVNKDGVETTSITVAGGVYTVTDGKISFGAAHNFYGYVEPVTYQVTDTSGATATSTVGAIVLAGDPTDPTDPVDPTDPAPTTPVDPTDPADPTNPGPTNPAPTVPAPVVPGPTTPVPPVTPPRATIPVAPVTPPASSANPKANITGPTATVAPAQTPRATVVNSGEGSDTVNPLYVGVGGLLLAAGAGALYFFLRRKGESGAHL